MSDVKHTPGPWHRFEACKAALAYIPNSVVRSWPPGFELKAKALELLRSAIAKATGQ